MRPVSYNQISAVIGKKYQLEKNIAKRRKYFGQADNDPKTAFEESLQSPY